MIFAVFGDIQGNFRACDALLRHLADEGIHAVFQTGNLLLGGENGDEILRMLHEYNVVYVQGEKDRLLARYEKKRRSLDQRIDGDTRAAIARALPGVGSANLEYLRTLPHMAHTTLEGIPIAVCHGSPSSQRKAITEETPGVRLAREREVANAQIVLLGGSPAPFHRHIAGTLFVAPGICAADSATAHYTLVNTEETPWTVEHLALRL